MEAEDSRRQKKLLLLEWDKLQANLRLMRQDLDATPLDNPFREEITKDIARLTKRKAELANELGYES
jgi:hypothetical protein